MAKENPDRMSNLGFRMMTATMAIEDRFFPSIDRRVADFGIGKGMRVVDYGCGPGRYTVRFAELVGSQGKVYAVDVQPLALEYVKRRMREQGLSNVVPVVASGYHSNLPGHVADMIFVLDMICGVQDPVALLEELHRICRQEGVLVVDDGHQPRKRTLQMIQQSGRWTIQSDRRDHLRCAPVWENTAAG
jgi:ubiquinone/menaquinone biosynthesis C-methylase UbiE